MLTDFFVTKRAMTQAWTKDGRRLCVTKLSCPDNIILKQVTNSAQPESVAHQTLVGFGFKKLANVAKAQRGFYTKLKLKTAPAQTRQIKGAIDGEVNPGDKVAVNQVLQVGDVVEVQGTTKGRGFAGVVKRHGFAGGPRTHGQSDRERAPGSIGNRTTPGRVFKGKRMAGHMGVDTQTIKGLVVLHIDSENQELWLSGPVPGPISGILKIHKTGETKAVDLHLAASGIKEESKPEVEKEVEAEVSSEVVEEKEEKEEKEVEKDEAKS